MVRSESRSMIRNSVMKINTTPTEATPTIIFVCFLILVTLGYHLRFCVLGNTKWMDVKIGFAVSYEFAHNTSDKGTKLEAVP